MTSRRFRHQVAAIREALIDHKVLFFRGQDLDDDDQVEFGRRLGELTAAHPVVGGIDAAHPEMYALDSADTVSLRRVAHRRDVHGATAARVDPAGRRSAVVRRRHDWADSQLAYESLSAPSGSSSTSSPPCTTATASSALLERRGGHGNEWDGEQVTELVPVEHPVVRVHPETGRKGCS